MSDELFDLEYLDMEHYKFDQVSSESFQNGKEKQFQNECNPLCLHSITHSIHKIQS